MIMSLSYRNTLTKTAETIFTHLRPVRRRAMRDAERTDRSI